MVGEIASRGDMGTVRRAVARLRVQSDLDAGSTDVRQSLVRLRESGQGRTTQALGEALSPVVNAAGQIAAHQTEVANILSAYAVQAEHWQSGARVFSAELAARKLALNAQLGLQRTMTPTSGHSNEMIRTVARTANALQSQIEQLERQLRYLDTQRQSLARLTNSRIRPHTSAVVAVGNHFSNAMSSLYSAPVVTASFPSSARSEALRNMLDKASEKTPNDINRWFGKLSPKDRQWLIATCPDLLGNLDGIPPKVRDACNRMVLDKSIAALDTEIAQMQAEVPRNNGTVADSTRANLAELEQRLEYLKDLKTQLKRWVKTADNVEHPLSLLGFRIESHPRAIVALGDVATATNIITHVPGMTTTVGGNTVTDAMTVLKMQQNQTQRELDGANVFGSTAAVFWLDYDAPAWSETFGSNSVISQNAAVNGAPDLVRFSQGLRAVSVRQTPARLTLSAHSYGTQVGFRALSDKNHQFDAAVMSGSPGYPRVQVHLDQKDLYLATNLTDFVSHGVEFLPVHGTPVSYLKNANHLTTGTVTSGGTTYLDTTWNRHSYTRTDGDGNLQPTSTDLNTAIIASGQGAPVLNRGPIISLRPDPNSLLMNPVLSPLLRPFLSPALDPSKVNFVGRTD